MIDLMTRTNDGLTVTLFHDSEEGLILEVQDTKNGSETWTVRVKDDDAMFAFHHPFAYREYAPSFVPTFSELAQG